MTEEHPDAIVDAILAGGVKIPPMPMVLVEFSRLIHNPEAGPKEIAALIGKDAALSGALFRVAGSPVFGLRSKADSLQKVITLLGLKTTSAVVQGESIRGALHDPSLTVLMDTLWLRLGRIAELAMATQKVVKLKGVSADQAFLLGLFHDCGVVLVAKRFPDYADAFLDAAGGWPDLTELDHRLHTSHAMVGQTVARNWQLPEEISQAIRHHHNIRLTGVTDPVVKLIVLLQFAMHLYNQQSSFDDSEWAAWQPRVAETFEMDTSGLANLEEELLNPMP